MRNKGGIQYTAFYKRIASGLSREYERTAADNPVCLEITRDKFVIVSDHHRGRRDGADDFKKCEKAYNKALMDYYASGYTLVILGDAEDLWECTAASVFQSYPVTVALEAGFHADGRLYKIIGNHDECWADEKNIEKYIAPAYNALNKDSFISDSLRLSVRKNGSMIGEIFLVHGHQGTLSSDRYGGLSKFLVKNLWRNFQRITGIKSTTPRSDPRLRDRHHRAMYAWAHRQCVYGKRLVLITGHTHLPVFLSYDIAGKAIKELNTLNDRLNRARAAGEEMLARDLEMQMASKNEELKAARNRNSIEDGCAGETPCFFNTGCCSFSDGDITAIELAEGEVRLVRWPDDQGRLNKKLLDRADLERDVFARL